MHSPLAVRGMNSIFLTWIYTQQIFYIPAFKCTCVFQSACLLYCQWRTIRPTLVIYFLSYTSYDFETCVNAHLGICWGCTIGCYKMKRKINVWFDLIWMAGWALEFPLYILSRCFTYSLQLRLLCQYHAHKLIQNTVVKCRVGVCLFSMHTRV